MNIWHQSFTVLEDLEAYRDALEGHFRAVARPDTTITLHGMRPGTFRTEYPGHDIKHAAFQYLHATQFLDAAIEAERSGADAYAISTLPEPGLREARSLVDIPVVGYGESAMLTACLLGQRFGVLVFIDELAEVVSANAVRHGFQARFGGAEHAGFTFHDVLEGFTTPGPLIDRFREAARKMIARGVDVIIPGEAPLTVLLMREGVTEVDGATVVDSLATWVKQAEMLVDLKRQGIGQSRCGYFGALPDPGRVDELRDFYHLLG